MAIESATNGAGSAAATAKNTTVIPSNQKPGTYTVTHGGFTYQYAVVDSAWGKVNDIVFYNSALEDFQTDTVTDGVLAGTQVTTMAVTDPTQRTTWTPPASFFPPGVQVDIKKYVDDISVTGDQHGSNGRVDHYVLAKELRGTGKKKKKPKEVPAMGNAPVMKLDDFGLGRFNPPPHNSSRSIPPTAFPEFSTTDAVNNSIFTQLESANNRGYFYQDLDSAIDLQGKEKKKSELWGFQFMYNPTTISYSNQANSNIDQTNLDDVANQLVGSQSINFEILINRTMDISALRDTYNNYTSHSTMSTTGINDGYPRVLTPDEVIGLYKRGTEFDIEFLYRCLNGDPQLTQAMVEPTSDYGYLAGVPIWLRFNDNVRYKGTINQISVQHVMFSENMVPMISKVSLSFIRMPTPTLTNDPEETKKFYETQFSKTPNYSGSSRTTSETS